MAKINKLKKIYKDVKQTVCFSNYCKTYYFAICKNFEKNKRVVNAVKSVLGANSIQCLTNDTFIAVTNLYDYGDFFESIEENFYQTLMKKGNASIDYSFFEMGIILYNKFIFQFYNSRMYSCCERKIIGKLCNKNITIFSTKRPCFLCLPVITDTWYCTEKSIGHIVLNSSTIKAFSFRNKW
mgnify:CR=1 FL=1